VFATYPAFDAPARNLFSEFLGTALLLLAVRALTEPRNTAPGRALTAVLMGLTVWASGLSPGLTGYAIDPARMSGRFYRLQPAGWASPNPGISIRRFSRNNPGATDVVPYGFRWRCPSFAGLATCATIGPTECLSRSDRGFGQEFLP
jgi:glycerol uptake facilitator-like aquaporin